MPRDRGKPEAAGSEKPDEGGALDEKLDEALMDTFPASDPVSLSVPTKPGRPNHKGKTERKETAPAGPSRPKK